MSRMKHWVWSLAFVMAVCVTAAQSLAAVVLVSDGNGNAIHRFDVNGTSWVAAGTFASGDYAGQSLTAPNGMALDASGRVYVLEQRNGGRILRFDASGNFDAVVATEGVDFTGRPDSITMGPDGNLIFSVAFGSDTNRLYKLNPDTHAVSEFIGTTGWGASFNVSRGVAVAGDGNLYVADRNNHQVRKFDATTGSYIGDLLNVTNPNGVSWDAANNRLLVTAGPQNSDQSVYAVTLAGDSTAIYDGGGIPISLDAQNIGGTVFWTNFSNGTIEYTLDGETAIVAVEGLGQVSQFLIVPEPASVILLASGGLLMLRRRHAA